MKKALITGITGQDGSYLAEFLLKKDYHVFGLVRRRSEEPERIKHLLEDVILITGDLTDPVSLANAVLTARPDEVYNLASQSHVGDSFKSSHATAQVTGLGAQNVIEASTIWAPWPKIYQAGSSEMFGSSPSPQDETTPFHPRSPYASAKVFAHNTAVNYREGYGIFISNGILFNHESPRRGETFVTRKISQAVARIVKGKQCSLHLGNVHAKRDWGYAPDYVEAMWEMLQMRDPGDYVIATGETHTVADFAEEAFNYVGLNWKQHVVQGDAQLVRPSEVSELLGNPAKAKKELGWTAKTKFKELVKIMVEADLAKN